MMASNHSLLRNDTIITDRATTIRRRKKHPFTSHRHPNFSYNHHRSRISDNNAQRLRDIKDISNVQLEQAIRSLQCYEGLQDHQDSTYRTFALEYIESILLRWSMPFLYGELFNIAL